MHRRSCTGCRGKRKSRRTMEYTEGKKAIPVWLDFLDQYYTMSASISNVCPAFFLPKKMNNAFIIHLNDTLQQNCWA